MEHSWYFTAPWEPISIRRGDALGFRASADYFADLLAPGLSNATSDARWISILCWCLQWSHVAWHKAGGYDLTGRDAQRTRYAWLRPLELLWVDRTLEAGQATGQLRGRRSVERWRNAGRTLPNFAMSPDQFRRYRQVGMYGAYRVIFRTVSGLTTGDGWTPTGTALQLANLVNESLPPDVGLKQDHFERDTKWGHWADDTARYWVKYGWPAAPQKAGYGLRPTPDEGVGEQLPPKERCLLEPVLFDEKCTRRITAEVLAKANRVTSHAELCDHLANSSLLSKKIDPGLLAALPAFSRFADASMHAMRGIWSEINHDKSKQAPAIHKLAQSSDLRARLDMAREAGSKWLHAPGRSLLPYDQVVTQLAETMQASLVPIDQLRAITRHHDKYCGGRRWFREHNGKMTPLVADTGIAASDYRFRLRALGHLAAQCGVAKMRNALQAIERNELGALSRPQLDDEEYDAL